MLTLGTILAGKRKNSILAVAPSVDEWNCSQSRFTPSDVSAPHSSQHIEALCMAATTSISSPVSAYRKQTKPCRHITTCTPPSSRTSSQNQIPIRLPSRSGHAVTQARLDQDSSHILWSSEDVSNNSLKTQWLCKKFYHALKMFKALLFNWMAVRKPRPLEGFPSGQTTAARGDAATLEVILTTFVGWVLLNKQKSSIQIVNGTRGTRWNQGFFEGNFFGNHDSYPEVEVPCGNAQESSCILAAPASGCNWRVVVVPLTLCDVKLDLTQVECQWIVCVRHKTVSIRRCLCTSQSSMQLSMVPENTQSNFQWLTAAMSHHQESSPKW